MILIDNSQIVLSSIFSQYKKPEDIVYNADPMSLIRHITLNTYRSIKEKFGKEYGDLVICQDSNNYWRRDIFPHYKANRKKAQQENQQYWDVIFSCMKQIREEVAENLPYKNMKVDRCEADDVISVIARHYYTSEKVLIVSNDKDFQQLLYYPNINIYSPQKKSLVNCDDPTAFLLEQIIRGDSGDGIPNILSDDDTLINENKRQKPITAKRLAEFEAKIPTELESAFYRNRRLIDLGYVPEEYMNSILEEYKKPVINNHKMFNYFVEHKLTNLMSELSSF